METRETINSYWILNLWEAIGIETIEINNNFANAYSTLEIGKEKHRKMITKDLLKPHLASFTLEDQQKICLSMQYVMKAFSEQQLVELLNNFGGTVFPSPSPKITTREFYMNIYHKLFTAPISLKISDYHDTLDKENFRNLSVFVL